MKLVLLALIILAGALFGAWTHGCSGCGTVTSFAHIPVGGGGFTSGIQSADDGTMVARVDVFGTYVYNTGTGTWDLLDTEQRMPSIAVTESQGPRGGIEIVVCNSNTNIIYKWMGDGLLYRSSDKGASFVQLTGFGTHDTGANNGATGIFSFNARLNGYKMACDPINPDVLYVGTSAGVLVSTNASQGTGSTPTFASTSGITGASAGGPGYTFAFDRNSGSTGGKTNTLYVSSYGQGIFKMTTPGGSFSSIASAPSSPLNIAVSPNGLLWVVDGTNAYKCVTCTGTPAWTTYAPATTGISAWAVAIDPNHSASSSTEHVIIINNTANLSETTTSGTIWAATNLSTARSSSLIPWLVNTPEQNLNASLLTYNKATDELWLGQGIGVWKVAGNVSAGPVTWNGDITAGIESLQTNAVVSCQNATSAAIGAAWDRAVFPLNPTGTFAAGPYPSNHGTSYDVAIGPGWSLDCAGASGDGITAVVLEKVDGVSSNGLSVDVEYMGSSTDNGVTWDLLPINTANVTVTVTANGAAAAGQAVLNVNSLPAWVGPPMTITNLTHAGTINAHAFVTAANQLTLDRNITGVGVSNGDTIQIGLASSTDEFTKATTSATASGNVLHFTTLPSTLYPGMFVYDLTTIGAINTGGNGTQILSISGGDVTLTSNVASSVGSGDVVLFSGAAVGGSIAVSTSTNWCITPSNNRPFPSCTQNGGQTYNQVNISGVPRPLWGSTSNGSTTITVNDTSNLVGGSLWSICDNCGAAINGAGCIPANTTVASITDSTHAVLSAAATCGTSANADIFVPETGWSPTYFNIHRIVAADRVTANKFYLYNYVTDKIYVSTDGGATWPNSYTSGLHAVGAHSGYGEQLKAVPGNAGHLFFSGADIGSQAATFMRSTDGGQTWSAVANVNTVGAFGFGKPKPGGGGYPAIFIYGKVSGVFSMWRSDDNASTWVNLGTANPVNLAGTGDIDGDKNVYGKFYGAGGTNGWWYGALN